MSDPTTDVVPECPVGQSPSGLTEAEVDGILDQFRTWLRQGAELVEDEDEDDPVDLHTLVGQFTALRHEVNLQTRAVRSQQQQNAETLAELSKSAQTAKTVSGPGSEDEARDLVKSLVDLHDTLAVVERELAKSDLPLEQTHRQLALSPPAVPAIETEAPRLDAWVPFWAEWFGCGRVMRKALANYESNLKQELARGAEALRAWHRDTEIAVGSARQILQSIVTGFTMNKQRLERALELHGLEAMRCQGESFDPELMEVVGTVAGSGLAKGTVVEVVRTGYRRQGRLFRCAQVTVAKD